MSRRLRETWFERLTGVKELSAEHVREHLVLEDGRLLSKANGGSWKHGTLEIPSLGELRKRTHASRVARIRVEEMNADVEALHADPDNAGCLFQTASQFNLLVTVNPQITPEQGVGQYEKILAQSPACAIAAGAGTIYRQYFMPMQDQLGQTAEQQVDCLHDMGTILSQMTQEDETSFWTMKNGYAIFSEGQVARVDAILRNATTDELDRLKRALRVGILWDTQVTSPSTVHHLVSQIYCSALPVAYCRAPPSSFRRFATLVLEAAYEATLLAAAANPRSKSVYLTLLGGGAFGNDMEWICNAMDKAFTTCSSLDLDVIVVTYTPVDSECMDTFISKWN